MAREAPDKKKDERQRDAVLVGVVILGLIALSLTLYRPQTESSRERSEGMLVLPKDAARLAPCEPGIGERWAVAGKPWPAYLTHRGKVIGIEYPEDAEPLKLGGYRFDHSERNAGAIRFYTITEQEQRLVCPPDYVVSRQIVVEG